MVDPVQWVLLLANIPSEPSRHRVALWRELRRCGAAPIGAGVWLVPDVEPFAAGVERARGVAVREGGSIAVIEAQPRDAEAEQALRASFAAVRADEWAEFVDDCGKFLAEIDEEFFKEKFTLGELEEEEQSMDRLRRWFATLQERNVLDLQEAGRGTEALSRCDARLAEYAERVLLEHDAA